MSAGVNGSDDELLGFGFAGSNAPMEARSLFQRRLVNEGHAKFVIRVWVPTRWTLRPRETRAPSECLKRVQEAARKRILLFATRAERLCRLKNSQLRVKHEI